MVVERDPLVFRGNIDELQELIRINMGISNRSFNFSTWYSEKFYGCTACLIGHYVKYKKYQVDESNESKLEIICHGPYFNGKGDCDAISNYFNISLRESYYLFTNLVVKTKLHVDPYDTIYRTHILDDNDKIGHINRVKKYLAYKLRKLELLGDYSDIKNREKYERARRTEGNFNLVTGLLTSAV